MKARTFYTLALLSLGFFFLYLGRTDHNYKPKCIVISSDANHGPKLAERYTYDGRVWANKKSLVVLGFSQYEDSIIYNSLECSRKEATYVITQR